ncbi:TIGR03936 family radical SAM-associated protein [Sphaerisporangium siamense]|uniref:Radical SAM-linked protein n=1 Tax=Sphaerisporangium siamense TaxID=795645 RepID=A0A7W7D874_9ACTN|nr:TIGR03936 family radical SAM-associated protein [Sphaerisporangium siamense]MBB4702042.1 radical SAM-linked protein [Sphaerisporangium siamense]
MRYAKRGRLRFTSHRDVTRAIERAVRRAGIPVGFSAGFTPHPKISYAGAAPTGVASEAEYLEIGVVTTCAPDRLRGELDASLPPGLDVLDVVESAGGSLAERLQGSIWEARLPGIEPAEAAEAAALFMAAERVEVERLTKKGPRRFDAREAVVSLTAEDAVAQAARQGTGETADREPGPPCAILRMVVRHVTPAVRPDDVLTGLRLVAAFAPPSPPLVTRLAQGPLEARTGAMADPLDPDRDARGGEPGPAVRQVEDHG